MRATIRALRGEHTVLLSSHILSEISQTCDRLLVIQRGEIVAQGSEQDLADKLGGGGTIEVEVAAPSARAIEVARTVTGIGDVQRDARDGRGRAAVAAGRARPAAQGRRARWSRTGSTCCASTAARRASSRSSCKLTKDRPGDDGRPQ